MFEKPPILKEKQIAEILTGEVGWTITSWLEKEALKCQCNADFEDMIKKFVDWLHQDIRREIHPDGETVIFRKQGEDWQELLEFVEKLQK